MPNKNSPKLPMDPRSVNRRWERFAQAYVKNGGNAAGAYRTAFNMKKGTQASANALSLLKRPEVRAMIEREQNAVLNLHNLEVDGIVNELLGVIERAKESGDEHALMKALDILNKMSGVYNHKQEIDVRAQGIIFNFVQPMENKPDNLDEK